MKIQLILPAMMVLVILQMGCGESPTTTELQDQVVKIRVTNPSPDTIDSYGLDLDLIPIDSNMRLESDGSELLFQYEDRNTNGLPDKLFASLTLLPQSTQTILGIKTPEKLRGYSSPRAQVILQDQTGQQLDTVAYPTALRHQGIVLENDIIGYRALSEAPFGIDVIGKRFADLVVHTKEDISKEEKWGGDVLKEGGSLGLGSPAIFDLNGIVHFNNFDSREVQVVANGPLRAEIVTQIRGIPVRDEKVDVQVTMEMHAGNQWLDMEVEMLSRTDLTYQFAFGLPKHEEATDFTQGLENGVHFAYTYGLQSAQGEQLGLSILVPGRYEVDHYREDPHDYFYLASPVDKKVQYRVLAAWVKGPKGIFDEVDFLNFARSLARAYGIQPTVKVEWQNNN